MAEQTKRQQLEAHLAARALQDPDFRERLLQDPRAAIEAEIGLRFPDSLHISVHEETLSELHVVLPIDLSTARDPSAGGARAPGAASTGPFWIKS